MQKIIIKNFGPIKDVELDVKDIIVLIGPQASGKSTIAKAIFFFKSLRDDLMKYIWELNGTISLDYKTHSVTFRKTLRNKFLDFWGPTFHLSNIYLEYHYSDDIFIKITLEDKYVKTSFSKEFYNGFDKILCRAVELSQIRPLGDPKFLSSSDIIKIETEKSNIRSEIEKLTNELFSDERDLLFIPAGRSLMATLSDQIQYVNQREMDFLTRSFADRINRSKSIFSKSLSELITEKKKLTVEKIDFNRLELAKKIISKILKAAYRSDSEGEKLYIKEGSSYIKLKYASSGQQEAMWILHLIFLLILENKKVFIVFEEPEAHLYPEAQKDTVDLISLLANIINNDKNNDKSNHVIVTTHSPYVLSSFNNLLYAFNVGRSKHEEVKSIIDERLWIDPANLDAFFVANGVIKSIMDEEYHMIKSEAIDSASEIINETYNKIFDLDDN